MSHISPSGGPGLTVKDARLAAEAADILSASRDASGVLTLTLLKEGGEVRLTLPAQVSDLVMAVLGHAAHGDMVALAPLHAELTTQEAADLLNVSRPHLTGLLEQGAIPFHKVGAHRRVRMADVMAYKAARDERRASALERLQQLGQELGQD
jgi:excisionase family DNA binding protein